jgi:hypothetical protein
MQFAPTRERPYRSNSVTTINSPLRMVAKRTPGGKRVAWQQDSGMGSTYGGEMSQPYSRPTDGR